jgi:NitT/TauT family transport system substrate-binding protein
MRAFALAVAAALVAGDAASGQELLKIAATQRGAWDTSVAELGQRAGIFKKHGLTLEILYTQGGAEAQQAVIAGSCDIAVAVGIDGAIGAFSKGAPLRIIGSEMIGSPDLYWYVVPASPVRKVEDMRGKTVAYSVTGSSSHSTVLAMLQQNKVEGRPVATGGMPATLTQTMSGQIDVGWAAAPFGLDMLEQGKIRLIVQGSDVASRAGQTVRVHVANLDTLQKRKATVARFMQGYRETLEWLYSDPAALRQYEEFSKVPESVMRGARDKFFPRETLWPDEIKGLDRALEGALANKFIQAPLSREQTAELVQIPAPIK